MSLEPIETGPDLPPRKQAGFSDAMDAWMTWFKNTFFVGLNAFISTIATYIPLIEGWKSSAEAAAAAAALSATAAAGSANNKGAWTGKTGAATAGWTYVHNGRIWMLLADTATIQSIEPSATSASWVDVTAAVVGSGATQLTMNALLGSGAFSNIDQIARFVLAGGVGEGIAAPTGNHTLADTDTVLRFGHSSTAVLTLKANGLKPGRKVLVCNPTAFAINSASSNVRDIFGTTAALILPAGSKGSWALLQDNGTTWDVIAWDIPPVTQTNATTTGTTSLFTAPYANPKGYEIFLNEVTYNSTSEMHLTSGDTGGLETAGYSYNLVDIRAAGNAVLRNASDNKMIVMENLGVSGAALNGLITGTLVDQATNTYTINSTISEAAGSTISNGRKATSAPLTQIQLTPSGATFTGGSITVTWRY